MAAEDDDDGCVITVRSDAEFGDDGSVEFIGAKRGSRNKDDDSGKDGIDVDDVVVDDDKYVNDSDVMESDSNNSQGSGSWTEVENLLDEVDEDGCGSTKLRKKLEGLGRRQPKPRQKAIRSLTVGAAEKPIVLLGHESKRPDKQTTAGRTTASRLAPVSNHGKPTRAVPKKTRNPHNDPAGSDHDGSSTGETSTPGLESTESSENSYSRQNSLTDHPFVVNTDESASSGLLLSSSISSSTSSSSSSRLDALESKSTQKETTAASLVSSSAAAQRQRQQRQKNQKSQKPDPPETLPQKRNKRPRDSIDDTPSTHSSRRSGRSTTAAARSRIQTASSVGTMKRTCRRAAQRSQPERLQCPVCCEVFPRAVSAIRNSSPPSVNTVEFMISQCRKDRCWRCPFCVLCLPYSCSAR